jgi:hypothetical protein
MGVAIMLHLERRAADSQANAAWRAGRQELGMKGEQVARAPGGGY